ncbi:hypothetical protein EV191_1011153 [Tamaricihabitans halophyticus]|uniref:Uncharacterized protein n=1 Tax=Tamaricihabitans halophyticus TaxID=1262583 RepID=A0A4R2R329_9PSEU|nr:hypothetical protein [Tamaricihabitans halophyticus]TCP57200.1 hypothetical protein EV191_1011153 [Tamaricihabitans halophyticus]
MLKPPLHKGVWCTVAQHRHVVMETRHGEHGETYSVTACGWLVQASAIDFRLADPPLCLPCHVLAQRGWVSDPSE